MLKTSRNELSKQQEQELDGLKDITEQLKKDNQRIKNESRVASRESESKIDVDPETLLNAIPHTDRGVNEQHNRKKDLSLKDKFIDKFFPSTLLINMELRNGDHITFLINANNDSFRYLDSRYVIDSDIKYYSRTGKTYCLDYHQDYALPIRRKFGVKEIKEAIKLSHVIDVEEASNPSLIQEFVDREVMKQLMKGQDIDDMLKAIKLPLYIVCAVSIIHLLIFVAKSGMLQQAKFW